MPRPTLDEIFNGTANSRPSLDEIFNGPVTKPMFANKQEADIGMENARREQFNAEADTTPLGVLNKAIRNMTNPSLNQALGGVPEMVNKGFVPEDAQSKGLSGLSGMIAGAPSAVSAAVAKRIIPSVGAKLGQKVIGGMAAGAAGGFATSPEDPRDLNNRIYQAAGGAVLGGIAPLANKKTIVQSKNNILRGGIDQAEAARIETQYGNSTGTLVDQAKAKLINKGNQADLAYQAAIDRAPEGKNINIRPSIEAAGKKLKNLGLITDRGNLTELGRAEISKDTVYGKLLDFYQGADAISGVEAIKAKGAVGDLTINQGSKLMAARQKTNVNVDQYKFFRDKLNSLYKGKPSDVAVSDVVNQFYQDGENAGIKGLQLARRLQREHFAMEDMFLNGKTGDMKIATEAKLNKVGIKPLSKAEVDHIKELEKYIGTPIISEAEKINKLNKALSNIRDLKKYAIGGAIGAGVGGGVIGGISKKIMGN